MLFYLFVDKSMDFFFIQHTHVLERIFFSIEKNMYTEFLHLHIVFLIFFFNFVSLSKEKEIKFHDRYTYECTADCTHKY